MVFKMTRERATLFSVKELKSKRSLNKNVFTNQVFYFSFAKV